MIVTSVPRHPIQPIRLPFSLCLVGTCLAPDVKNRSISGAGLQLTGCIIHYMPHTKEKNRYNGYAGTVVWSPDSTRIASAGEETIQVWQA